jgi:hypothetical protein
MPVEPLTKPAGPAHVGLQSVDWIGSLVIVVSLTAAIALARPDIGIAPVAGSVAACAAVLLAMIKLAPARSSKGKAS